MWLCCSWKNGVGCCRENENKMSFFPHPTTSFFVTQRMPPLQHFPHSSWECDTIRKLLIREELLRCVSHHSSSVTSTHLSWTVGKKKTLMLFQVLDYYSNFWVSPYRKLQKPATWFTHQNLFYFGFDDRSCILLPLHWLWRQCCAIKSEKDFVMLHHTIHSSPNVLCSQQDLSFFCFPFEFCI